MELRTFFLRTTVGPYLYDESRPLMTDSDRAYLKKNSLVWQNILGIENKAKTETLMGKKN